MIDLWWKAAGTAIAMALVIITARRAHRRVAGLLAAFPMVTAPALWWLARDQGTQFAAEAAVSSVASCVMQAGFALGYARASRRLGAACALVCGLAAAAGLASFSLTIGDQLTEATCSAAACVFLCIMLLPAAGRGSITRRLAADAARGGRGDLRDLTLTVVASALLSTLAASLGAHWGPGAAGLLASLPVICGTMAVIEHVRHGHAAAGEFLRAYVHGLFGRVLFGMSFALAAPAWGALWALLLATLLSFVMCIAAHRLRRRAELATVGDIQRA